ncbi:MAG: OmpA family protein [Pseudomonadota bacterium]
MNTSSRWLALVLVATLSACAGMDQNASPTEPTTSTACIIAGTVLGGAAGGAGMPLGVAGGAAAGAGIGAVLCGKQPEAQPERVAMVSEAPADADGDGVPDDSDQCPGTPAGVVVDSTGCPVDADGDGVNDDRDRCLNTPAGATVDSSGCPVSAEIVLTVDRLNFAFDSAELDATAKSSLRAAVDVVRDNSAVELDLVGHTDSRGSDAYNQGLSERRARAALDYLVSLGVPEGQLRAVGRGESSPVADNSTEDGRARNRRVEIVVR